MAVIGEYHASEDGLGVYVKSNDGWIYKTNADVTADGGIEQVVMDVTKPVIIYDNDEYLLEQRYNEEGTYHVVYLKSGTRKHAITECSKKVTALISLIGSAKGEIGTLETQK